MEPIQIEWYSRYYSQISSTGKTSRSQKFLHRIIERNLDGYFENVLDIGGGKAEHLKYVRHKYGSYTILDFRKDLLEFKFPKSVQFVLGNAEKIPFPDGTFDRIIVTCLLHHVSNPLRVIKELKRNLRPGGIINILLPHDPGFLYRTLQTATSFRNAKRSGVLNQAKLVHALEHKNNYWSLNEIIRSEFLNDWDLKIHEYPIPRMYWQMNAFTVFTIRKSK